MVSVESGIGRPFKETLCIFAFPFSDDMLRRQVTGRGSHQQELNSTKVCGQQTLHGTLGMYIYVANLRVMVSRTNASG